MKKSDFGGMAMPFGAKKGAKGKKPNPFAKAPAKKFASGGKVCKSGTTMGHMKMQGKLPK